MKQQIREDPRFLFTHMISCPPSLLVSQFWSRSPSLRKQEEPLLQNRNKKQFTRPGLLRLHNESHLTLISLNYLTSHRPADHSVSVCRFPSTPYIVCIQDTCKAGFPRLQGKTAFPTRADNHSGSKTLLSSSICPLQMDCLYPASILDKNRLYVASLICGI